MSNVIGFLFQTYDATAGLIGNALRFLAVNDELCRRLTVDNKLIRPFLWEMLRFDPPVQNTRRFATKQVQVGDATIHAGDQVLLVLAAANRDSSRFANPGEFDLHRRGPAAFGFGLGRHECPGKPLAIEIASAALEGVLPSEIVRRINTSSVAYRPSVNARIPLF